MGRILPETVNHIRKKYNGLPILKAFEQYPEDLFGIIDTQRTDENNNFIITPEIIDLFSNKIKKHYQTLINRETRGQSHHAAYTQQETNRRFRGPINPIPISRGPRGPVFNTPVNQTAYEAYAAAELNAKQQSGPITPRSTTLPPTTPSAANIAPREWSQLLYNQTIGRCVGPKCKETGGRRTRRTKTRRTKTRRTKTRRNRH